MSFEENNFEKEKNLFNDLRLVMEHLYHITCAQYNRICELNTAIEERDAKISQLKEELQTVNSNYEQEKVHNADKLQQETERFKEELAKKDALVKKSIAAFETAKERYEKLKQGLDARDERLKKDEDKFTKDRKTFDEKKDHYANLSEDYKSLESKYNALNDIATSKANEIRGLKDKLESAQNQITDLSGEIAKLKANPGLQNANNDEQQSKPVSTDVSTNANNSASNYQEDETLT